MSRVSLTDAEVLAPSDVLDWWIPSRAHPERMRTLLETGGLGGAQPNADRISLFRPPGDGVACAWIWPDQVHRLARLRGGAAPARDQELSAAGAT
jgi:hypothetical protein